MEFYQLSKSQVFEELQTSDKGLTENEAKSRLEKYGENKLKEEEGIKVLKLLVSQFNSIVVYILLAAFLISLFLGERLDAIVIGSIIVLNTFLGFFQEYKAEKSIRTLKKFSMPKSFVVRNGQASEIDTNMLIPGDLVLLESGSFVPADCYLIEAYELKTDESLLTGESVPVQKRTGIVTGVKDIGGRENIVFSGSTIVNGRGKGIVIATGMETQVGKIAEMIQEDEEQTPLQKKLDKLGTSLGIAVVIIAFIILGTGVFRGEDFVTMVLVSMSIAVAAIPEGLPAVVTISLAFGVQKMLKKNVLVRRLSSVETLGSTTTICVPADTPVFCNPSINNISNIEEKDKVLGLDGSFHIVLKKFVRPYKGDIIKIKPVGLPEISITPEHPILVTEVKKSRPVVYASDKQIRPRFVKLGDRVWLSASEINENHLVMVPRIKSEEEFCFSYRKGKYRKEIKKVLDLEFSELLGWYLAEGCTSFSSNTGRIVFYLGKNERNNINRLVYLIQSSLGLKAYTSETRTSVSITLINIDLAKFFKENFGTGASNKKIPHFMFRATNENVLTFLKGYLKGDGNVSNNYIRYWTTSKHVAYQMIVLLAKLGLRARLNKRLGRNILIEGREVYAKDAYELFISATQASVISPTKNLLKEPKKNFFLADENFVYYPIKNVSKKYAHMDVYNIETGSNTYCLPFVVHNCADKTGTLTQNKMTVVEVYVNDKEIDAKEDISKDASKFLETIYLSNDVGEHRLEKLTDPADIALSNFVSKRQLEAKKVDEDPFTSEKKYSAFFCEFKGKKFWNYKLAVEVAMKMCNHIQIGNMIRAINERDRERILKANENMASKALRVLAFAYSLDETKKDLVFVGLTGMIDPPRPGVKQSIEDCKTAGIKVIMVTGDHKITAQAIARQIGLGEKVITGDELEAMDNESLKDRVRFTDIFARVNPSHKVRILDALKANGEIVAMTGDGINDAPALKKADIGVAVGTATDVAKESSDMVLLDNDFSSIAKAVEEGRGIYDNIKKFVNYLLSSNMGEVMILFFAILLAFKVDNMVIIPLTAVQILWINLITDGLPALALGVDNAARDVMHRKPRNPKEKIVDKNMWISIFMVGIFITVACLILFKLNLPDVMKAQTMVFTALVVFELGRVYMIRSQYKLDIFSNKWLIGAVLSSFILQLIVLYSPLRNYFDAVPLGIIDWALILVALAIFVTAGLLGFALVKRVTHEFD